MLHIFQDETVTFRTDLAERKGISTEKRDILLYVEN
jgi:hypothetical protein